MLKNRIKECKILYYPSKKVKKICMKIWVYIFPHVKMKRRTAIEKFKDIHEGERCFVVATGPSLTKDDLKKLKYDYSFSMNSIINLYGETHYRPTYYLIQDGLVERRLRNELVQLQHDISFIGIGNIGGFSSVLSRRQASRYNSFIPYNLDVAYHIYDMYGSIADKIKMNFSDDCAQKVYDGCTVTYSAIQLACYMGFKKIYLLGCDCDYHGEKQHFLDYGLKASPSAGDAQIVAYTAAKEYADTHGIKIYNATRGGKLEVFERVDFDSLFPPEDSENNAPKTDK